MPLSTRLVIHGGNQSKGKRPEIFLVTTSADGVVSTRNACPSYSSGTDIAFAVLRASLTFITSMRGLGPLLENVVATELLLCSLRYTDQW